MTGMDHNCPRCGSDAAVTWASGGDATTYTCRFSHGGEGPYSWVVGPTRRAATRTRAAARPTTTRQPAAARKTPAAPPAPRLSVNDRGIAAVVAEVTRRGGQARVEATGSRREIIVTREGHDGEVRLLVRARTAGDWQTRASYGEPRVEEANPSSFWVLVHLTPGAAQCYVVPDWWMRDDIFDKHGDYLQSQEGSQALSPDSDHHAIRTERVTQWLDRWDQLTVLR